MTNRTPAQTGHHTGHAVGDSLPATMQAIAIHTPGGPEVLTPVQQPLPALAAGEVLIRVAASGVNRPDVVQRKGHYPPPPGASPLPGLEVAGTIVNGDPAAMQATGLRVGDTVCALVSGCLLYTSPSPRDA